MKCSNKVTGYREVNRMAVANLAIVFGPTLVSSTNVDIHYLKLDLGELDKC